MIHNIFQFDIGHLTKYLTFYFDYIIREWMIPGQIENWVFVTNLKEMKVSSMISPVILFSFLIGYVFQI